MSGWRKHKSTKAYRNLPKMNCSGRRNYKKRCRKQGRDVFINLRRGKGKVCNNCLTRKTSGWI